MSRLKAHSAQQLRPLDRARRLVIEQPAGVEIEELVIRPRARVSNVERKEYVAEIKEHEKHREYWCTSSHKRSYLMSFFSAEQTFTQDEPHTNEALELGS